MEQPLPAEQVGTQHIDSCVGRGTESPRTWKALHDFSKSAQASAARRCAVSLEQGWGHQAGRTVAGQEGGYCEPWARGMPKHPPGALTGCWGLGQEGCSTPSPRPGPAGAVLSPGQHRMCPSSHRTREPSPAQGTLLWCRRLSGVPTRHIASTKHPNTFPRWCGHRTWQAEQLRAVHEAHSAYLCAPGLGAGSAPQPSQKLLDQPHWQL